MTKAVNTIGCLSAGLLLLAVHNALAHCMDDIVASAPTQDFTVHGDGTVTQKRAGLMWMQCPLGMGLEFPYGCFDFRDILTLTWQEALVAAQNHNFAEYRDWRLPNKKELASIIEQRCTRSAVNTEVFYGGMEKYYWSSSPSHWTLEYPVWVVDFTFGTVTWDQKSNKNRVLLVRDVQ